jgi:hypothetical protein
VSYQSKTGYIGHRVDLPLPETPEDLPGGSIEGSHALDGRGITLKTDPSLFKAGSEDPGPQGFGEKKAIPCPGGTVSPDLARMDLPYDRKPEEGLRGIEGMPSDAKAVCLLKDPPCPLKDPGEEKKGSPPAYRKPDKVQSDEGCPPHGIDIAQGVGTGNLTKELRIIHKGGEEIGGKNEGAIRGEDKDRGVIPELRSYKETGIAGEGEGAKDLL